MKMVDVSYVVAAALIISAFGVSFVSKDYIGSFVAGLIFRHAKHLKPGVRIKVITSPIIKGDIISIGPLRTTLYEVGDGERLPSIRTGRIYKLPNFFLFTNPILIYKDVIADEVIVYLSMDSISNVDAVINDMKEAITACGLKVIEVGLHQKEGFLIVHGIFESETTKLEDVRSKVLRRFLKKYVSGKVPPGSHGKP